MKTKLTRILELALLAIFSVLILTSCSLFGGTEDGDATATADPTVAPETDGSTLYYDYDTSCITKIGTYDSGVLGADIEITEDDIKDEYLTVIYNAFQIDETATAEETESEDEDSTDSTETLPSESEIAAKLELIKLYDTTSAVKTDDFICLDYAGYQDGELVDNTSAENAFMLVGEGGYVDGFEDAIIGKVPGVEFSVDITFPEDYSETLAGQTVTFVMTVHEIMPELSEATLTIINYMNGTSYTTTEEYTAAVKEELYTAEIESIEENLLSNIVYQIYADTEFSEIPESDITAMTEDITASAEAYGLDLSTYMYYAYGITDEDEITAYIEYQVAIHYIIAKIIQEENISISDEEYETVLAEYVEYYEYESGEALEEEVGKNALINVMLVDELEVYLTERWNIAED